MTLPNPSDLAKRLRSGERRALAQAITLVESTRPDHRQLANQLLDLLCLDEDGSTTSPRPVSKRVGISGTPGVGKSTVIEALGLHLIEQGHRVAVLAIDPSSIRTGGSIMGDKTRMTELSRNANAFIRPSASHGLLGGVANRTGEVIGLVEAAGYDVVIVETVGVGQSEVAVASITDLFVLLVAPAGGDDLQGIKRGVMELVDAILVNKADGDLVPLAERTATDYRHALSFLRLKHANETPPVLTCSALFGSGVQEAWRTIDDLWLRLHDVEAITSLRAGQASDALDREIEGILIQRIIADQSLSATRDELQGEVVAGHRAASSVAAELTSLLLGDPSPPSVPTTVRS